MMNCGPNAGTGRGLQAADADGDGKISRAEFMQHQQAMFEQLPKDRNGLVSVEDALREGRSMGPAIPSRPGMTSPGMRRPADGAPAGPEARPAPAPGAGPPILANPEPERRASGSSSPDGEPDQDRGTGPAQDSASSRSSSPASTPSSTAPQDAKPGR